jgi:O-succinylbenzoate synthase
LPSGPHGRQWRALGADGGLAIERAELLEVSLPFRHPVATAVGTHRVRPLVLVRLICRDGSGEVVEGWGECAALEDTTYDVEDVATAWTALEGDLLPRLLAHAGRRGGLPSVGRLGTLADPTGRPLAWSAMEMAVADAWLRASDTSLAGLLGVGQATVPPGAVLGLPLSAASLLADLERLGGEGYARVKVKVAPGAEPVIAAALGARRPNTLPVQVDANGAYDNRTAADLRTLDDLGLLCIEQPLARDDLAGHRDLAASLVTPICLDESLDGPARVLVAVRMGACTVVCVKPSRLGGIGAALDVIDWCHSVGLTWWIGGMFESGVARHTLVTLAALPGPTLPGDLAAPETYLTRDLVAAMGAHRDPVTRRLALPVHDAPGVAPAPSGDALASVLVRRWTIPRATD